MTALHQNSYVLFKNIFLSFSGNFPSSNDQNGGTELKGNRRILFCRAKKSNELAWVWTVGLEILFLLPPPRAEFRWLGLHQ
jgi:hypothetical protein